MEFVASKRNQRIIVFHFKGPHNREREVNYNAYA